MNDLLMFLTSKEIIVIYIIAALACVFCLIIYLVEKLQGKLRMRHNTRELNKLVEKVKEKTNIKDEDDSLDEPIIEHSEVVKPSVISEMVEDKKDDVQPVVQEIVKEEVQENTEDKIDDSRASVKKELEVVRVTSEDDEFQYTTIEPDQVTAQLELKKLTEELRKQEQQADNNILLTNYEEQQEEEAIISLDELIAKGKHLYASNEATQYIDDDTAPISLEELATQAGGKVTQYEEPFIIENVVPKEEVEIKEEKPTMHMDDFYTVKSSEVKRFKSSPIISPIYGIEKNENNDLELENTANYEKLDREIKKSNEFFMSLKDLHDKLRN